jgi:hypothetical protein
MRRTFQLSTSDADEFEERIKPLGGRTHVRPVRGARLFCQLSGVQLEKLSMFVVKAPTLSVYSAPRSSFFGLDIPLGRPFVATACGEPRPLDGDIHLLMPDQALNLLAASDLRVLAVKLNSNYVAKHAFRLSGLREAFKPASERLIPHVTAGHRDITESLAVLWSDLQRKGDSPASAINIAESVDRVFTSFCFATQGEGPSRNPDCASRILRYRRGATYRRGCCCSLPG